MDTFYWDLSIEEKMFVYLYIYCLATLTLTPSKSHGRCQWCCLCTEAVSCGGGCIVQQNTKHVLRSMMYVLINFLLRKSKKCLHIYKRHQNEFRSLCFGQYFTSHVAYSSRKKIYESTLNLKPKFDVTELLHILLGICCTAVSKIY